MASAPRPWPELRKLDYFAGTWMMDGEIRPGAMGPGGKMTETDRNQWMDGGFFLVVRSEFMTSMGDGTGVAYMGYDPNEEAYTYDEFNSVGEAIHSKGAVNGNLWTWSGERNTDGVSTKTRLSQTITCPASYDFKFEISQDGTNWTTVMDGWATRQK